MKRLNKARPERAGRATNQVFVQTHINRKSFRMREREREREDRPPLQALEERDKCNKGADAFVPKRDFKHCGGMRNPQPRMLRNDVKHLLEGAAHLNTFPFSQL